MHRNQILNTHTETLHVENDHNVITSDSRYKKAKSKINITDTHTYARTHARTHIHKNTHT